MTVTNPYQQWLERWFSNPDPWGYEDLGVSERYRTALEMLPARAGSTLEVGCGEGHFTEMLAPRATALVAVELIPEAAERARRRLSGHPHVRVRNGDAMRRLPLRRFDTVLCMGMLYYVPERLAAQVRGRLVRRLKPGGLLLLQHELDDVVREWDPEAGGAEALHSGFMGLGLDTVGAEVSDGIETLVLRRGAAPLLRDALGDVSDLVHEPWPSPMPASGWLHSEVDLGSARTAGDGEGPRRVLLRLAGQSAGLSWAAGPPLDATTLPVAVARAAADVCPHLRRDTSQAAVAAALLEGELPNHPLSPEPRPLEAGEVQVAVCTNRGPEQVAELLQQLGGTFDTMVMENGSPESRLGDVCRSFGATHRHSPAGGLASARNRAMSASQAPWILFLDDDCRLASGGAPELARRLGGAIDRIPGAGAITGLVLPETLEHSAQVRFELGPSHVRGFLPVHHHSGSSTDRMWPIRGCDWMGVGACMAVRRDAWAEVGGFDERLGAGTRARSAEDDAFFRALVEHGWAVFYDPHVSVRHRHRAVERQLLAQAFGYGLGRSVHVLLCALDDRNAGLLRLWVSMLVDQWGGARRRRARLARAELAGYGWGPLVALRAAWDGRDR